MGKYFINKLTNGTSYVGEDTPSVLNRRLTETYQVGTEVITIDGQQIEQPKLELVWKEISKEEYDLLNEPKPLTTEEQQAQKEAAENEADLAELTELSYDIVQHTAGEEIPNFTQRKARFIEVHNRVRARMGKEPRKIR